jgi:hypothetical protein
LNSVILGKCRRQRLSTFMSPDSESPDINVGTLCLWNWATVTDSAGTKTAKLIQLK